MTRCRTALAAPAWIPEITRHFVRATRERPGRVSLSPLEQAHRLLRLGQSASHDGAAEPRADDDRVYPFCLFIDHLDSKPARLHPLDEDAGDITADTRKKMTGIIRYDCN